MTEPDQRLKSIQWHDLLHLTQFEIWYELTLSLPWLLLSLYFASISMLVAALGCSFMFFLTGLRQVHNAFHHALGISAKHTDWLMFVLSVLMLGSMHAIKINHLRHHRYCMTEEDVEAMSARMPAWKAILIGPIFPFKLHLKAFEVGNKQQRLWMQGEIIANIIVLLAVFFYWDIAWLQYHFATMLIAQCLTSFFAVWTVHHDCEEHGLVARTIRNRFKAKLTYNMFYHVEHHLFPAVPTCKLHHLSSRLDAVAPELALKKVF